MNEPHQLRTRRQLIQYIKSFIPPAIIIDQVRDAVVPTWDLKQEVMWKWDPIWFDNSTHKGIIALIELLENTYGIK